MRRSSAMLLAAAALAVAGCASGPYPTSGTFWLYRRPNGDQLLVDACQPDQTAEVCRAMPKVQVTKNAADQEAWQFEARQKQRAAYGIPVGRIPVDVIVVGPREQCEQVRQQTQAVGTPTEPCLGPLRFRYGD